MSWKDRRFSGSIEPGEESAPGFTSTKLADENAPRLHNYNRWHKPLEILRVKKHLDLFGERLRIVKPRDQDISVEDHGLTGDFEWSPPCTVGRHYTVSRSPASRALLSWSSIAASAVLWSLTLPSPLAAMT